jgi:RNA polymerase sigma-70 factor, ECF subfamily
VSEPNRTAGVPGDSTPGTLGGLLYADKAKPRISEDEWVELVRSLAAGDQLALHALYERTHRLVFTLTMRISGNRQTAEELTLDVFHDVWRRASEYDAANGSVIGWIMNQARSRAIDRVRFEQRKKRVDPHVNGAQPAPGDNDPYEAAQLNGQVRELKTALTVLTQDERQAIEAAYFSGLTYAEAAVRLNQPLGTIKTRIRAGLTKLRQVLNARADAP